MRKIAFSDIHGCNRSFAALLEQVAPVSGDELYFLGDYIDRGPDTKGVIDRIWELEQEGFMVYCLRGNHEQMLFDSFTDFESRYLWLANGGNAVISSFGVDNIYELPWPYLDWMDNLGFYLEVDEYILVHAGLNFETPTPFEDQYSMLWIRRWYEQINYDWLGDRIIIHGHTPLTKREIVGQQQLLEHKQYLDIDAGCAHKGRRPGLGQLCAFDLTNRRLFFQENIDY